MAFRLNQPSKTEIVLPNEILVEIFSHIDKFNAKLACRRVNRRWLACVDDRRAWKHHFDKLQVMIRWEGTSKAPVLLRYSCGYWNDVREWSVDCPTATATAGPTTRAKRRRLNTSLASQHCRFLAFLLARIPLRSFTVVALLQSSKIAPEPTELTVVGDLWTAVLNAANSQLTEIKVMGVGKMMLDRTTQLVERLRQGPGLSIDVNVINFNQTNADAAKTCAILDRLADASRFSVQHFKWDRRSLRPDVDQAFARLWRAQADTLRQWDVDGWTGDAATMLAECPNLTRLVLHVEHAANLVSQLLTVPSTHRNKMRAVQFTIGHATNDYDMCRQLMHVFPNLEEVGSY